MRRLIISMTVLVFALITGCALTFKIQRHYSQGEQVYIQKKDKCGRPDKWGEIAEQPDTRDSTGSIIYRVRGGDGWVMPYTEDFLDSLNSY